MLLSNLYFYESIPREILRVLIYLFVVFVYLTTTLGFLLGIVHLFLAISKPKKFGMSRILSRILPIPKN